MSLLLSCLRLYLLALVSLLLSPLVSYAGPGPLPNLPWAASGPLLDPPRNPGRWPAPRLLPASLGPSWRPLGPSLGALGRLWAAKSQFPRNHVKTLVFAAPGALPRPPGASWAHIGGPWASLGCSWAALGRLLAVLSGSYGLLGPLWAALGPLLRRPGAAPGLVGAVLEPLGPLLRTLEPPRG